MTVPYYEVVAFTSRLFHGNPAGVCVLDDWLADAALQAIAAENNLPETAFIVGSGAEFAIRWMTPTVEVDLCGHATLATAHVLFSHRGVTANQVRFRSQLGELSVGRDGDLLVLDFPAQYAAPSEVVDVRLRATPTQILKGRDYLAVFGSAQEVAALGPDFDGIAQLDAQGVIATAPGDDCDFVSRYFAPAAGIPEDPVTGSTHCVLIPYWAARLGKRRLHARQISARGGELFCENRGDRVSIGGHAVTYIEGALRTA